MIRRSRQPIFSLLLATTTPLFLSILLSALVPLPQPQFHDEFSYLLAADTFSHGRLTNPPHQFWRFFETFQVLQQPTYMSKYPPMQGLFLALGKVATGVPIAGVWLSTALACAVAWWALRGVMPRRWATLGALLIATHPMILSWNWSFWGGAPAMIGGCLVVGAIARFAKRATFQTGILLGVGIAILLNSRPFEGAVITILIILAALYRSHGRKSVVDARPPRTRVRGYDIAVTGCLFTLACGALWTGFYNHRVTGRATQFPYMLYEEQYAATAPLIWLPPPSTKPSYTHPVMRDFYLGWELNRYNEQRTFNGLSRALGEKSWSFLSAYFASWVLLIPFAVAILNIRRDRKVRTAAVIGLLFLPACFSGLWFFPHYTAPAAIIYFIIIIQGMRHIRARWRRLNFIIPLLFVAHLVPIGFWIRDHKTIEGPVALRAQLAQALLESPWPKHLVFIRPLEGYNAHNDWVYNDADIDQSRIVWARDMGDEANRALMDYFSDRDVWLFSISATQVRQVQLR